MSARLVTNVETVAERPKLTIPNMYVDDGYLVTDAASSAAVREMQVLNDAFKLEIKPAHFFLGNNVDVLVASSP